MLPCGSPRRLGLPTLTWLVADCIYSMCVYCAYIKACEHIHKSIHINAHIHSQTLTNTYTHSLTLTDYTVHGCYHTFFRNCKYIQKKAISHINDKRSLNYVLQAAVLTMAEVLFYKMFQKVSAPMYDVIRIFQPFFLSLILL